MQRRLALPLVLLSTWLAHASARAESDPAPVYDIVVHGDSSGAVVAAIAAKRDGRSILWVNPTGFPGGMSSSGLLPRVHRVEGLANGQGDKKIQAYNHRVCLTSRPENRMPIEKPPGYREIDHELPLRNFEAGDTRLPALIEPLAGEGGKVDWNNMHAVGSDCIGGNWDYPEATHERRREIEKEHETYIRGFLWTLANHPRVPETIRKRVAAYGLPKDEFTDNGGWPRMIYIREARRMVSDYVMTRHDCEGKRRAPDPVALGSFGMDSHAVQHFVTERGHVVSDGVIWRTPPRPYGVSYRSMIPKKGECENLFSPICLSASHVAHGSIRMEPVFMVLSQSAAIAAGLAIDQGVRAQDVPYPDLRRKLEAARQIVGPETWKRIPATKPVGAARPVARQPAVFEIEGNKAYLYAAPEPAPGQPWIWYAPVVKGDVILARHALYRDAFLNAGVAIAGFDLGETRGSPESTAKFTRFYDAMVQRGYSAKPILLGQSRGGLMTLAWAVRHPDKVRAWAGIYPVCNLASWPLKSSKKETLADFAMTEDALRAKLGGFNPVDNLAGLAENKVPIFAVHGDMDALVPYDDNTKLLQERYKAAGGACDVKIVAGGRHEISPAFFECRELIEFVLKHAKQ